MIFHFHVQMHTVYSNSFMFDILGRKQVQNIKFWKYPNFQNLISVSSCTVLVEALQFDLISGYVVTRKNPRMVKYFSISYNEILCLSLMHLFWCDKFDMADEMYICLAGFMADMKHSIAFPKQNRGVACNGRNPTINM